MFWQEKEQKEKEELEARQNLSNFFELALKVALREGIDIGQFDNYKTNKNDYAGHSNNGN